MSNRRSTCRFWHLLILLSCTLVGCTLHKLGDRQIHEEARVTEPPVRREIETANVCAPTPQETMELAAPITVNTDQPPEDWFLSLDEVIQITLANSDVIRDLGGRVVSGNAPTTYDVALTELGVEQALSSFDAQLTSSLLFNKNERAFNNSIFAGQLSTGLVQRAFSIATAGSTYNAELSKIGATGTQYLVRNITTYDDSPIRNQFAHNTFNTAFEAEFRHPLLRGGGLAVNRIAGPNAQPGNYNGVVIARIRTDIALADFEAGVRNLIRDVEAAYWRLYFAYRTLDARMAAYEAALGSWRTVQDQFEAGTADGEAEALARAAYYQAKAAMRNALAGGTNVVGVHAAERDLRVLMGIPANDGRLIRPADEPSVAERIFEWRDSLELAVDRRVELRRQRWVVKQRESELVASKNLLLSQIDLTGLYRWSGFGDDLIGQRDRFNGSAFENLWSGDLQGWQLGLQYSAALGKRREHAAVRAAELQLARDRAILRNQEQIISNDLSTQFGELDRSYLETRDNFNRSVAERQRLGYAQAKYDVGEELLEFVLQAQRNTADADSEYYRTLVDYNLAVSNLHYARGTYLDYMGVRLSEGSWSGAAYDSYSKEFRRFKPRLSYCKMEPGPVSSGNYSQVAPVIDNVPTEMFVPAE